MARIFLTHCSRKKNPALIGHETVPPDVLYTAVPIQRFIRTCKERAVEWAIFSDLYGVWLPSIKHAWYEKSPDSVSEQEYAALLRNFDSSLRRYRRIFVYHNPGRFHRLYRRLVRETRLTKRIVLITHLRQIG